MNPAMRRIGTYPIQAVLPYVCFSRRKKPKAGSPFATEARRSYDGIKVWMTSLRYQTFATSGTICKTCGLKASYFALEQQLDKPESGYHFNLYGLNPSGQEVLFTKDHILPKSKGGKDLLENLQTMCAPCNQAKSSGV